MWGSDTKTLKNRAGRIYVSAFHPNLYAKYNTGAGIVKLHCLRRKYLHFFPKILFSVSHPESQKALASQADSHLFGCADPQSPVLCTAHPEPNPIRFLMLFPPTTTNSKRFCWSDCSHSLGMIAPCQHQRKQTFTPRWLKLLHAFETAELTR